MASYIQDVLNGPPTEVLRSSKKGEVHVFSVTPGTVWNSLTCQIELENVDEENKNLFTILGFIQNGHGKVPVVLERYCGETGKGRVRFHMPDPPKELERPRSW